LNSTKGLSKINYERWQKKIIKIIKPLFKVKVLSIDEFKDFFFCLRSTVGRL
jgi:hypothetical protein